MGRLLTGVKKLKGLKAGGICAILNYDHHLTFFPGRERLRGKDWKEDRADWWPATGPVDDRSQYKELDSTIDSPTIAAFNKIVREAIKVIAPGDATQISRDQKARRRATSYGGMDLQAIESDIAPNSVPVEFNMEGIIDLENFLGFNFKIMSIKKNNLIIIRIVIYLL